LAAVKLAAAVLIVIAAVWAWERHQRIANQDALAAVAGELAGWDVGVECQGFFAELVDVNARAGDVEFPAGRAPDHMFLTRKVCTSLEHFRKSSSHRELDCLLSIDWSQWSAAADFGSPCARRARSTAEAINTLAHEAMHLRGFVDEAETQCYAIQTDAWTVERLGGTRAEGAAVAAFILSLQPLMPSEYQASACGSGGGLDLHPETPVFPTETVPALPSSDIRGPALGDL
jgi:hypothetical protein